MEFAQETILATDAHVLPDTQEGTVKKVRLYKYIYCKIYITAVRNVYVATYIFGKGGLKI